VVHIVYFGFSLYHVTIMRVTVPSLDTYTNIAAVPQII
jgi:hypothetical protein